MTAKDQPRDAEGRFVNLERHRIKPASELVRWMVVDTLRGRRRKSPRTAKVPVVKPDVAALKAPPPLGAPARLTWLGHASWLVQLDGVSLLIDPVLRPHLFPRIKRNAGPGLEIHELPRIDASLVSHSHYDHLDEPTLAAVGAPVVGGLGIGAYVRRSVKTHELAWWQTHLFGAGRVKVHFVPAQHWSRRARADDTNRSLWGGFVVEGSRATVYHSGDTAYFSGFREIGQRFPVDAAMLPIGAYDPEWFMREQHMNPEDAAQAFEDLRARTFLAMHWGTFKLTDEPLDEPPMLLREQWSRRRLDPEACRIPAIGETVHVARAHP